MWSRTRARRVATQPAPSGASPCDSGRCIPGTWTPSASSRCGERPCWPRPCCVVKRAATSIIHSWNASSSIRIHAQPSTRISQQSTMRQRLGATTSTAPRSVPSGRFRVSRSRRGSLRMSGVTCKPSWRLAAQRCTPDGARSCARRAIRCSVAGPAPWRRGSAPRVAPDKALPPTATSPRGRPIPANGSRNTACHPLQHPLHRSHPPPRHRHGDA